MRTRFRILFVDNDPEFLRTRSEVLEVEGYEVISASSPEEARTMAENSSLDLAIVDLRLCDDLDEIDTSGLAFINNVAPHLPKILLTAYLHVEVARRALKHGLDDQPAAVALIQKQEGVEVLLRAVSQFLTKKAVQEDTRMPGDTRRPLR